MQINDNFDTILSKADSATNMSDVNIYKTSTVVCVLNLSQKHQEKGIDIYEVL